jgi:hypothetical protein
MPSTEEVTVHCPVGVGGFTVADAHGNVRIITQYVLPSGELLSVLHDDELAGITTDTLTRLRSEAIASAEIMRDLFGNDNE